MPQTTSPQASADRVSTLELFFDLVFVFTITQVSDLLLHAHSFIELARPGLLLALIWRIAPFNISTALLVVLASFVPPTWSWLCWIAAVTVLAVVPFFGKVGGFAVEPAHFVERHGLDVGALSSRRAARAG
jgi:low temperature requirement protein LtrA